MAILLGSANRAVIKRWRGLLSSLSVVEATSLDELKRFSATGSHDLVMVHRPLVDLAAFEELRRSVPLATRFFLLSDRPGEEEGLAFLKLGIAGYANTYITPSRLLEAIRVITGGGVWLGREIIQRLILETAMAAPYKEEIVLQANLNGLTRMERAVAELVARGMTNLEIAADLNITERTVKAHLTSVYGKTKTGNRLALALLANRK